ncbi:octopamine receptor beta-2R-like [Tachypleus tridentatus]|uniref:octopamine receptor beta-2R-like n=1 Tax=Tachypleus tridentatus TaxID=6853 RepID=UPI003FD04097
MEVPVSLRISGATFLVALALITFLTNIFCIYAILRNLNLRYSLTNIFLVNLFSIGLMISFTVIPTTVGNLVVNGSIFSQSWCDVMGFLNSLFTFQNMFAACLISGERYLSIAHPMFHAAYLTKGRVTLVLILSWIAAIVIAFPPLVGWSEFVFQPGRFQCFYATSTLFVHKTYVITVFFLCFLAPATFSLCMYIGIFRVARNIQTRVCPIPVRRSAIPAISGISQSANTKENHVTKVVPFVGILTNTHSLSTILIGYKLQHIKVSKAIKTLLLIASVFFTFLTPEFVVELWLVTHESAVNYPTLVPLLLFYISFVMNPLLYGYLNRPIRQEVLIIIKEVYNKLRCYQKGEENLSCEREDFYEFLERTTEPFSTTRTLRITTNDTL